MENDILLYVGPRALETGRVNQRQRRVTSFEYHRDGVVTATLEGNERRPYRQDISVSLRGPANPPNGAARALSAAEERMCASRFSSEPWSRRAQSDAKGVPRQAHRRWKAKTVALVATARKLLVILNAIVRDKKPWATQNA